MSNWQPKNLAADELTFRQLSAKYNVSPQAIAAANDVPWTTSAVTDWIIEAGGKMLESGHAIFQPGNRILLPAPRQEGIPVVAPPAPSARTSNGGDGSKYLLAGAVAGLLFLAYKNAQRKDG